MAPVGPAPRGAPASDNPLGRIVVSDKCACKTARHHSRPQEVVRLDSRLPQYCPERSFRHVAWMIRHRCITIRAGIEPDFMATRGLTVEFEAAQLQLPNDLSVPESCQAAHFTPRPRSCSLAVHWLSASSERRRARAGLRSVSGRYRARYRVLRQRSAPAPPDREVRPRSQGIGLPAIPRSVSESPVP